MHFITPIHCDLMHLALDDFVTIRSVLCCIVLYRTNVVLYFINMLYRSNIAHNL